MAENTLGYEPQDPSVFATEGDQAAATVPAYVDETEEGKVREASQKTPSSIAKREDTNSVSVEDGLGTEEDPAPDGGTVTEPEPDSNETPSDPDASEAGGKGAKGA